MRFPSIALLAAAVCLFGAAETASAQYVAPTIGAVSPTSIYEGSVEEFLTIRGSGFLGADDGVATLVDYSGPAGDFTVEWGSISDAILTAYVPDPILFTPGTYTVSVRTVDGSSVYHSSNTASFVIVPRLNDQPPVLSIPEAINVEATSVSGAVVTFTVSAYTYGSPGTSVPVTCDHTSGATYPIGGTDVTCSATDSFGTTTGQFAIYVSDNTPPTLTLPANITSTDPVVTYSASATDTVDGAVPVLCHPASGSTFAQGTTIVNCSATDDHANVTYGSFRVTITNSSTPILSLPADMTVEATGPLGAVVNYVATADQGTVVCNPPANTTFPIGMTTVECTATSSGGGVADGSFNVTVQDTTAPTLTLPADITIVAPGSSGEVVTFTATAHDIVNDVVDVFCAPGSGSTFPGGATVVNCSATDSFGNTATGSFNVTIENNPPPVLTLPADITAEATSASGAVVTFTPTATQNATIVCTPPSGSTFAIGTTTVNCTATNSHGGTASGSFHVTVRDTTPPVVFGITPSRDHLEPDSDHNLFEITFTVDASDTVSGTTSQIVSVTSDQPVQSGEKGDLSPDWVITGPLTVQLRAEQVNKMVRTYTITIQTTDSNGNVTTNTVQIQVIKDGKRRVG